VAEAEERPGGDAGPTDAVTAARQWLAHRSGIEAPDPEPRDVRGSTSDAETDGPDGPDADPVEVARRIVLRKLAAQARTRTELARALQAKAVPEEAATAVLDRMDEIGLIDDAAFASEWVSSRQQRRHLSRSALRRELQGKGVAREEIEEALQPVGIAEEYEAAISLARRRQAGMAQLPRDVQHRRLAGVLGRRGFGGSVTSRVLSELLTGGNGEPAEDDASHLGSADA
jgi:regulatory protein